jgi:hypothetical protein
VDLLRVKSSYGILSVLLLLSSEILTKIMVLALVSVEDFFPTLLESLVAAMWDQV